MSKLLLPGLIQSDHLEDIYVHTLWNHTPLIQDDVPEYMDEPSRYGLLISPRIHLKQIEIARSYHQAANVLWDMANDSGFPMADCYPVLFAYRHALELYLKMLGDAGKELDHNLKACMETVEKHYDKKVSPLIKEWIMTLHQMDETGWHFRYEPRPKARWMVNGLIGHIFDMPWIHFFNALDFAWLNMNTAEPIYLIERIRQCRNQTIKFGEERDFRKSVQRYRRGKKPPRLMSDFQNLQHKEGHTMQTLENSGLSVQVSYAELQRTGDHGARC